MEISVNFLLRILSKQRNPIRRWLEIKLNSYYYIPLGDAYIDMSVTDDEMENALKN